MALPLKPYHPQGFIQNQKLHPNPAPRPLHPSASPKCHRMFKHLQCEAHWTTPAADIHHGSCHTKTLLAQPLRQQKLHPNPRESSSIFNATPTGPSPLLTFSMVHLVYHAQPRGLPVGGGPGENRSPTVTKLPPGPWPGKGPSVASGFPTYINNQIENRPPGHQLPQ